MKTLTAPRLFKLTLISIAIFILGFTLISFFVNQRVKAGNNKVRDNLYSVTLASILYYDQHKEYTKSAMFLSARSCTGEMFTDVTSGLVGLTGSSDIWPHGVTISCQADGSNYAVSASLPKPIDDYAYWCVDGIGSNGPTKSHQAQGDVTC